MVRTRAGAGLANEKRPWGSKEYIKDEDVKDSPRFREILPEVMEFVGLAIPAAYNAAFWTYFFSTCPPAFAGAVGGTQYRLHAGHLTALGAPPAAA